MGTRVLKIKMALEEVRARTPPKRELGQIDFERDLGLNQDGGPTLDSYRDHFDRVDKSKFRVICRSLIEWHLYDRFSMIVIIAAAILVGTRSPSTLDSI